MSKMGSKALFFAYDVSRRLPALGHAHYRTNLYYLLYCPTVMQRDNHSHAIFVPQGRVNRVGRVCVCVHIMGFGALIVEING